MQNNELEYINPTIVFKSKDAKEITQKYLENSLRTLREVYEHGYADGLAAATTQNRENNGK